MKHQGTYNATTNANRRQVLGAVAGMGCMSVLPWRSTCAGHAEISEKARSEWWTWRGPNGNNVAAANASVPYRYGANPGFVWQTAIPGRGHSSPIVTGDSVYVSTADKVAGTQSALSFSREDGKLQWSQVIHRGGIPTENHPQNTEASPTMAFDGKLFFVSFYNASAIWLTAMSVDGNIVWQKSVGKYDPQRFKYGYAASPLIYKDSVIVVGDYDGDAFIAALDRETGNVVWRTKRTPSISFSSPIVARTSGRDQLVISGNESIISYDPDTGTKLWQTKCLTMATCGTMVWDADRVYASGGYPKAETVCVLSDGSGKIAWNNNQKCYEQSLLIHDGYVYAVTDPGVAHCWRASDGNTMWRQRLGGKFSCSPLLVGDVIHIFNEQGEAFAFRAKPQAYELLGSGKIADDVFATPAVVGNTMYLRFAKSVGGQRQEYLAAIR